MPKHLIQFRLLSYHSKYFELYPQKSRKSHNFVDELALTTPDDECLTITRPNAELKISVYEYPD